MSLPDPVVNDMDSVQRNFDALAKVLILEGDVNPENLVEAPPGTLYIKRTEPAALWQKETGTGNSGWTAR